MTAQPEVTYSKLFQMYSVMAHVVRAAGLTARMRRVTLGGEGLRALIGKCLPADALKLYLPLPGEAAVLPKSLALPAWKKTYNPRAYTIRCFRPDALELDVDVLLHGDSPGSVWARTVQTGDQIGFFGPRHDYRGAADAEWQLLAGDESALPAIAAILEHLPASTRAYAFIEVKDASDELPIASQAAAQITWLHRGNTPAKSSQQLEQALANFPLPSGKGYCWAAGNASVIKNIRRHWQQHSQLTKENMAAIGYWS